MERNAGLKLMTLRSRPELRSRVRLDRLGQPDAPTCPTLDLVLFGGKHGLVPFHTEKETGSEQGSDLPKVL